MIASRPFCHSVSSHRPTDWLASSSSFIASTRARVSGLVWRSLASWASASSTLMPDRMGGVGAHLDGQLAQAVDDRVGELGVEPGELEHPVGPLVDHVADQRLVGVERARHPADRRLEHRHVAVLVDRRGERVAEQRRDLHLAQARGDRALDEAAEPLVVEAFENVGDEARGAVADARVLRPRGSAGSGRPRRRRRCCASAARPPAAIRKFSLRKFASASPMRSLLRGMIAVCGIGRPSGWRNRAVTANQSASPPTIAASANALT